MTITTETELESLYRVKSLFERAAKAKRQRLDLWQKNYRLVHNRGWGWQDQRSTWQPPPQASEVYPILSSRVGWMTDQRVTFQFNPAADPHSPFAEFISDICHDLEQLVNSLWLQKSWDQAMEQVLWDAAIYQIGVFKVMWDPGADDGEGNPLVARVDPFAFYPDPNATSFWDADYLIEGRRMSWTELERRFPWALSKLDNEDSSSPVDAEQRDDPYRANKMPMTNSSGYPSSATSSYGLPGQNKQKGGTPDGVFIYEAWIRENQFWTDPDVEETFSSDRWRVIVCSSNQVLMDEYAEDLWRHGRHPYVRYLDEDLGDLYGIALVDHLAPCQYSLNRLTAALQAHAELVGNPVFMEDTRSGISRQLIVNRPGNRIRKTTGSEASWLVPPQMSRDVPDMIKFWIGEMEKISGLSAMTRGMTPTGRNAQGVLDAVQESAFVRVRKSLKSLERSLREIAMILGDLIVENYDLPRVVSIVGPQASESMMYLKSKHFFVPTEKGMEPVRFSVNVSAGASHPTSRSARAQEADTLAAMGHLDTQAVLEAHDYPNRKDIVKRVMEQRQEGTLQQAGGVSRRATRTK